MRSQPRHAGPRRTPTRGVTRLWGGRMTAQAQCGPEAPAIPSSTVGGVGRIIDLAHVILADRRVKFVLTGALNTAFGFGCFVAYQYLAGVRFGYMWTLVLAHITTVLFA